jgi:hypothetical protein
MAMAGDAESPVTFEAVDNYPPNFSYRTTTMSRRPYQKAQKYADYERRVAQAIQQFKSSPKTRLNNTARANGLSRKTLYNRYYGHTHAARSAHLERRGINEEENAVVQWLEKRNSMSFPPKHKELVRMLVAVINSKEDTAAIVWETTITARFLNIIPRLP